jgi:hypothetical protein
LAQEQGTLETGQLGRVPLYPRDCHDGLCLG